MVEESASSREISLGLSRFAQFFSEASSSIGEILLKLSRFSWFFSKAPRSPGGNLLKLSIFVLLLPGANTSLGEILLKLSKFAQFLLLRSIILSDKSTFSTPNLSKYSSTTSTGSYTSWFISSRMVNSSLSKLLAFILRALFFFFFSFLKNIRVF